jgi:hypothetical protein
MVQTGLSINRWRTFVKTKEWTIFSLFQRFFEYFVLLPEVQNFMFQFRIIKSFGQRFKHIFTDFNKK